MKSKIVLLIMLALVLTLPVATLMIAARARAGRDVALPRPQGPCDIYGAAGTPCVAAHSTTRALYASYNGPLYQVMRQSDSKTLDIGIVQPSESDAGDMPTPQPRTPFVRTPPAGSPRSTTNPETAITLCRHPAADSAAQPWVDLTTSRSPIWRQLR